MTKKYLTRLLQASLMCCLAVLFTACDDFFGNEANPTPAYLSMSEKPVTIKVGETFQRQAIAAGTAVIEYTSSDTKIATVDNTGLVTAIAEGEATITATATGYSSQTGKKIYLPDSKSYKLTVESAGPAATITTPPVATAATISAGSATDLVTAGVADGGTMMYRVTPANEAKPTSTDGFSADIPSASNRAAGTYSVWYYAKGDATHSNSKIAGPVEVTLQDGVAVTSVTLDKAVLRIYKYAASVTLTATVSPDDATDKTVTWKSSDETVATVNASGKVIPQKAGKVTITATANDGSGMKATSTVYVYDKIVDINTVTANVTVYDNEFWLINGNGTAVAKSITIGNGATVTLNGINITQQIACSGTATIYLSDGSTNTVTAPDYKAGIQIGGTGTTLTINAETAGTGILNVTGGDCGAGIGMRDCGDDNVTGGDITINGGVINATGGNNAAGIGTGYALDSSELYSTSNQCGDITINGGTVTATGGNNAAGIGTGHSQKQSLTVNQTCGDITIATGVTSVTAKFGSGSSVSIGMGNASGGGSQSCGTITFGTAAVFNGSAWSPSPMAAGTYGGLNLAISGNTWTLTPAN